MALLPTSWLSSAVGGDCQGRRSPLEKRGQRDGFPIRKRKFCLHTSETTSRCQTRRDAMWPDRSRVSRLPSSRPGSSYSRPYLPDFSPDPRMASHPRWRQLRRLSSARPARRITSVQMTIADRPTCCRRRDRSEAASRGTRAGEDGSRAVSSVARLRRAQTSEWYDHTGHWVKRTTPPTCCATRGLDTRRNAGSGKRATRRFSAKTAPPRTGPTQDAGSCSNGRPR